jgi:hypothetical protein
MDERERLQCIYLVFLYSFQRIFTNRSVERYKNAKLERKVEGTRDGERLSGGEEDKVVLEKKLLSLLNCLLEVSVLWFYLSLYKKG